MLIQLFDQPQPPTFSKLIRFWKRRWFRTLPNYYLVLLLNALFVYTGFTKGNIEEFNWKFFLFLHNFSGYFTDFFWESWSLSVEEWFYLLTPLALLFTIAIIKPGTSKKFAILSVILFFIFSPLVYRLYHLPMQVDAFWYDVKFRKVVLMRLDAIMYGVLFAWFKIYAKDLWEKHAKTCFVCGLMILYAVIASRQDPNSFYAKSFYFSFVSLGAAMLLPLAEQTKSFSTRVGKSITHISIVSYSMYLLNLGIIASVISAHFMPASPSGALVWYLIYWIAVFIFSTLLYNYFEKPVMDLRDRKWGKSGN
ncbi:MAG TPA: acyltransferase, partial [Bacteroidia bacterium]|nr:acyltransferase [Bacteroidia bacterium]